MLETERLVLRRWKDSDAEDLYQYAKDPDVGPAAGWPPHQNVDESLDVIRNVFNGQEAYAICLKTDNSAIGAIELKLNGHTDITERDDDRVKYGRGEVRIGICNKGDRQIKNHQTALP